MKNIIFIAPPAAGKGTMSKMIQDEYNIPHISTGDLLRDEVNKKTSKGIDIKKIIDQGQLVSDDIITDLLKSRLLREDCRNGYILDGYPRNVDQAKIYEDLLKELHKDLGVVIFLDIDKNTALQRVINRIVCPECGSSYNLSVKELQPKKVGICDRCHSELKVRSDDNEITFSERFQTYMDKTNKLIDYYQDKGILQKVSISSNDQAIDTFNKIKRIIND